MKLDCCVVRDLLPLYVESMVSDQTAQQIKEHLAACGECRKEYESFQDTGRLDLLDTPVNAAPEEAKPFKKVMRKLNRQMHGISYGLIIFFILWGFSLTGGEDLMYNSVIMPIVGLFGYYVFRWKALYKMPIVLLVINLLFYSSVFPWTFIYSFFVLIGVLIAFLLHFAFRKEPKE
jgi:hypothetical protein